MAEEVYAPSVRVGGSEGLGWGLGEVGGQVGVAEWYAPFIKLCWWKIGLKGHRLKMLSRCVKGRALICRGICLILCFNF